MRRPITKRAFLKTALLIALGGAVFGAPEPADRFPVEFLKVGEGAWVHRSYALYGGVKTPSNGLILETERSAVLIDTAWDEPGTERILRFIDEAIGKPVAACFITHSHDDRAGGLRTVADGRIPVYMTDLTYELLGRPPYAADYRPVRSDTVRVDDLALRVDYFGPAHAPDNITVWEPSRRILFGGCIVKSADSRNVGNVADADPENWPRVIRALHDAYPDIKLLVPGHGPCGDGNLLKHTLALLGGSSW